MFGVRRLAFSVSVLLVLAWTTAVHAEVVIRFYSHDLDEKFPHAFVVLKGKVDATGEVVDTNLGYSALQLSPAILVKSVKGVVDVGVIPAGYIARSQEHFSLTLSDDEYRTVLGVAEAWRTKPYNLNSANCVHFVSDILVALNMKGEPRKGLMKSPRSFLDQVTADSAMLIAAHVYRAPELLAPAPPAVTASAQPLPALAE